MPHNRSNRVSVTSKGCRDRRKNPRRTADRRRFTQIVEIRERWSTGVLEYWSIGVLEFAARSHHSGTPMLHYSIAVNLRGSASICGSFLNLRVHSRPFAVGVGFFGAVPSFWFFPYVITTTTRMAIVVPARRRRPIFGPRLRVRDQGRPTSGVAIPIATMFPTPKSKGCLKIEKRRMRPDG